MQGIVKVYSCSVHNSHWCHSSPSGLVTQTVRYKSLVISSIITITFPSLLYLTDHGFLTLNCQQMVYKIVSKCEGAVVKPGKVKELMKQWFSKRAVFAKTVYAKK